MRKSSLSMSTRSGTELAAWEAVVAEVVAIRDDVVSRTLTATTDPDNPDLLVVSFPDFMLASDGTSVLIPSSPDTVLEAVVAEVVAIRDDVKAMSAQTTALQDDAVRALVSDPSSRTHEVLGSGSYLVAGAVGTDQIAANSITADKLAANAVTAEKLDANAVDSISNTVRHQLLIETTLNDLQKIHPSTFAHGWVTNDGNPSLNGEWEWNGSGWYPMVNQCVTIKSSAQSGISGIAKITIDSIDSSRFSPAFEMNNGGIQVKLGGLYLLHKNVRSCPFD